MHAKRFFEYYENVDRKIVQNKLNQIAASETDYPEEDGVDILSPITWYDNVVCENKDSARDLICEIDTGWYDQIAVKYKEYVPDKKTKALINKEKQVETLSNELYELDHKQYFKNHKSKRITCKKCDSAINKDYIKRHWCPLCGNDLRSKTEIDKVEKKKEKLSNLKKQIKKMELKNSKKYNVKWLVKIEYHI